MYQDIKVAQPHDPVDGGSALSFEEMIEQVLAILQRRGGVSYRALKRQFNLDEACLADLKHELITVLRLACDREGHMLAWEGASPGVPVRPRLASLSRRWPVTPGQSHPHTALTGISTPPDAERRQLTVMFCDLVGSTALSTQLDPEDLRDVVRAYQETAADVIEAYEGYIAQYLGDGLLVYFGYPCAHEDDAQRAVRTGLALLNAMQPLNDRLETTDGLRLAIRLGIHTGPVVVGEMGGGERHERLALGETPNLAARLEGLAAPDTVVVSAPIVHLLADAFAYESLGWHTLKGIANPIEAFTVLRERDERDRLDERASIKRSPLIGRIAELRLLLDRWSQCEAGFGQMVLLRGEAGIGKSRLVSSGRRRLPPAP